MEKRKELNISTEGVFFNRSLEVEASYSKNTISDHLTQSTIEYPTFYGAFRPYTNSGIESYTTTALGVKYNKQIGDFKIVIGANCLLWDSKVEQVDELYADAYQNRTGKPTDARFALVADGLFQNTDEIKNAAFQTFGEVRPGDIKYLDQNKDGIIDANDQVQVGRSASPFSYGLNLLLTYKRFSFFITGTGLTGAQSYKNFNYYSADADDRYSVYSKQAWTPDNQSAIYPRISSKVNTNNLQNSTFWMYNNTMFSINRAQLTYSLPDAVCNFLKMKQLDLYINGTGILNISKNPEYYELNIGTSPQTRNFTVGVRTSF
jgi:hypothetical protein